MRSDSAKNLHATGAEPPASKGDASRSTILLAAAKLATIKGFDGLSIGDLAAEVGMSKSGLYAHFKSKEELEVATIQAATEIFEREVLIPAMKAPAGTRRLMALADAFLDHLKRRVFPGGCFFAAVTMEIGLRSGPARDQVVKVNEQWLALLKDCLVVAKENAEIDKATDIDQSVFEVEAMLLAGNYLFIVTTDPSVLAHARKGVENALSRMRKSPAKPAKTK